jgi:hypothetical protein
MGGYHDDRVSEDVGASPTNEGPAAQGWVRTATRRLVSALAVPRGSAQTPQHAPRLADRLRTLGILHQASRRIALLYLAPPAAVLADLLRSAADIVTLPLVDDRFTRSAGRSPVETRLPSLPRPRRVWQSASLDATRIGAAGLEELADARWEAGSPRRLWWLATCRSTGLAATSMRGMTCSPARTNRRGNASSLIRSAARRA